MRFLTVGMQSSGTVLLLEVSRSLGCALEPGSPVNARTLRGLEGPSSILAVGYQEQAGFWSRCVGRQPFVVGSRADLRESQARLSQAGCKSRMPHPEEPTPLLDPMRL